MEIEQYHVDKFYIWRLIEVNQEILFWLGSIVGFSFCFFLEYILSLFHLTGVIQLDKDTHRWTVLYSYLRTNINESCENTFFCEWRCENTCNRWGRCTRTIYSVENGEAGGSNGAWDGLKLAVRLPRSAPALHLPPCHSSSFYNKMVFSG